MGTRRKKTDPHAAREARRYERPIASREHILDVLGSHDAPLTLEKLAKAVGVKGEEQRDALAKRLRAMERDGQVVRNRARGYGLVDKMDLHRGRVIGHADGFGFLALEEGGDDLFLSPKEMRQLMHGDRVLVRITGVDHRGREQASVVQVLERNTREVVGRIQHERGVSLVMPDNRRISHDILIPEGDAASAEEGQIVVVELTEQPSRRHRPMGRVVEVLGDHLAPGMEVDVAMRSHEIPHEWPEAVLAQAESFGGAVSADASAGRKDLRKLPLVTIDGEDARDFDDAVFCRKTDKGWNLVVAIADVSHYVSPASPLDGEARERGTSVYFPNRVIPMLPENLSNGLCSLNPEVDRLCLACEMSVSSDGEVRRARFFEAVMRSHARLTYTEVAKVITGKPKARKRLGKLSKHLDALHEVYGALRDAREHRGAIDFDTVEARFVFDDEGKIADVAPLVRNEAHRLIEECMIAANISAACFLQRHKMPFLYRIHAGPSGDKLADLRQMLSEFGLRLGGGVEPEPKDYVAVLQQVSDQPEAPLINSVMLRSLSQAVYSPENIGHFGLALENYAHFTSPIRRYPDLLVHRAIRHVLQRRAAADYVHSRDELGMLGEQCSAAERRADEATREAVDGLKCEYMLDKVGEVFNGVVSGVTSFGLFVELERTQVSGLVHVSTLGSDYFHFDPVHHRLEGEGTGLTFRLGDPIKVRVVRVNLDDRKVDMELASLPREMNGTGRSSGKRRRTVRRRTRR